MTKKEKEWYKKWWIWAIVILACMLFLLIKISNLKYEVDKLESELNQFENDAETRINCLNDYVYYMQDRLKLNPRLRIDERVEGALSIFFPEPTCYY